LATEQTLKRFHNFWLPGLLNRKRRVQWLDAGAETLGQRLNTRVKEIIKEHQPKPLETDKKQKVREILAKAAG
jgi:trimethylamine:corrinoid methyltransferase-like protein